MIIETSDDKNFFHCKYCEEIFKDICELIEPTETMYFQRCIAEILEFDGHTICERFLRLLRCGVFDKKRQKPLKEMEETPK